MIRYQFPPAWTGDRGAGLTVGESGAEGPWPVPDSTLAGVACGPISATVPAGRAKEGAMPQGRR